MLFDTRTSFENPQKQETTMWPASTARPAAAAIPQANRWLALGAVAGPALFTLAWFVLGFLSPGFTLFGARIAPYSPVSQPISGLGLGPTGPFMNAAFVLSGLLLLAGEIGIVQGIGGIDAVSRRGRLVL